MNTDQLEGKWKRFKGDVRKEYGKLTDDDWEESKGSYKKFVGKVQERYGETKETINEKVSKLFDKLEKSV